MRRMLFILILFFCFVVAILVLFFISEQEKQELINNQYSGIVTEIHINAKNTPLVELNSKNIRINFGHFDVSRLDKMEIGDSLFKEKESRKVEHYKKNKTVDSFKLHRYYYIAI